MPVKYNNNDGSPSLEDSAIHRSRSLSKSFKNLFSSHSSSETSNSSSNTNLSNQQRSLKQKAFTSNSSSGKEQNLAQLVTTNNAAKLEASNSNNDESSLSDNKLKPLSPRSSPDKGLLANSSLEQSSDESPVSDISSAPVSPLLKSTIPATPTLLKKMNNGFESNNLIDEELDNSIDLKLKGDDILNSSNEHLKKQPDIPVLNIGERSNSGRGRTNRRSSSVNVSRDASPQISSREPSLSPQRSDHQYRSRGMSVSQANFYQPHLVPSNNSINTVGSNANYSGHIKRSATLVKGQPHGDNRGVIVNNRHMIWESETFKLYRNFTHEHKLSALPLIDVNPDLLKDTDAMKELIEIKGKESSSFSIGTFFKSHKNSEDKSSQVHLNNKGYIPSKTELQSNSQFNSNAPHCKQVVKINAYCSSSMKKKKLSSNGSNENLAKTTPTIVNTKAAIAKDELNLINDLTNKMKSLMNDDEEEENENDKDGDETRCKDDGKNEPKESDFREKYGYCAGTLGQGAYGVVKVTCRKLKENTDPETKNNTPYVVDNIAKKSFRFRDCVFFAVKELQANKKNIKRNGFLAGSDESDSDSDDSDSTDSDVSTNNNNNNNNHSEYDEDSFSGTSDILMKKLQKHRKRKNRDYDAKFCTRLTSEFVIGHALNNVGRHPNILKIFDLYRYDNIDNKFLQVMEFCPSGDLHSLIKRIAQAGNGRTVSRDTQLPPIGAGPVFIGDTLNLMDGGTGFAHKENDQLNPPSSNSSSEGNSNNPLSPTGTNNKLTGSQKNLLDSLIQRKQEKHNLLHPLEIDCLMKQLINGVAFMHSHGVAHCDLKPENILFKPNGILKISDFGTSCVFQTAWEKKPHYQTGCFGSEPYMSPEQFIPKKQYDPRLVDTFAVGVIYVTMAMGHYPWKSPVKDKDPDFAEFLDSLKVVIPYNAETKQQEIITGEYEPFEDLAHVNPEMKLLRKKCLYRMLHPNPNKRVLVKDVLNSNWMKRTHCCVIYKNSLLE